MANEGFAKANLPFEFVNYWASFGEINSLKVDGEASGDLTKNEASIQSNL